MIVKKLTAFILACSLLLSGCSTILSKTQGDEGHLYSGFVCNIKGMSKILEEPVGFSIVLLPIFVIDLPLSLLADTLFLPADFSAKKTKSMNHSASCKYLSWLE